MCLLSSSYVRSKVARARATVTNPTEVISVLREFNVHCEVGGGTTVVMVIKTKCNGYYNVGCWQCIRDCGSTQERHRLLSQDLKGK